MGVSLSGRALNEKYVHHAQGLLASTDMHHPRVLQQGYAQEHGTNLGEVRVPYVTPYDRYRGISPMRKPPAPSRTLR